MKMFILLFCLVQISSASESILLTQGMKREELKSPTRVKFDRISITVPQGWSVVGDGSNFAKGFTTTPTKNVETEDTYLGIHFKDSVPQRSLESLEVKAFKGKSNRTAKYLLWSNQKWLLIEYKSENDKKKPTVEWAGFFIKDNIEYVLIAGTTVADEAKFRTVLISTFQSVVIQ